MSGVTFDQVTKQFGDTVAVDHLDLEVADRELMVLLGPSGCGKTTALRMIAGLEPVTSGTLRIGEQVVNDIPPKHRDIAMVFQSYALYPHMTVRKNIESPLVSRGGGIDAAERQRRVAEAADILSLGDYLDRKHPPLAGRPPRPQAARPVGWSTTAGGPGPGHRAAPRGVPHGRAVVQPRRQA